VAARSGSKSLPDKNIRLLGGYPLLAYRILTGLASSYSHDLWISTDSDKYAEIAEKFGATKPFLRPAELSDDKALSADVVLHAMNHASSIGLEYDYIGLLEPTSPFVRTLELDQAIAELESNAAARGIVAVKEAVPNKMFVQENSKYLSTLSENLKKLKRLDRQAFSMEITPSGGFYISRWEDFLKFKTFYTELTLSSLLEGISTLEIDEPLDWLFAEFIIDKALFDIKEVFKI